MEHELGFQTVMRRFLKGDEGMIPDVIYWLKHHSEKQGIFNCITDQNGFTLNDLVSYDSKHNEENGEKNQDGPDYNYSWNCGAEGPSRKKLLQNFENIRLIMRFSCYFFHKEHHVYWQEMNSVTPKRAIIMFTARTILSDGRTGGGWKRKRRYMILLKTDFI